MIGSIRVMILRGIALQHIRTHGQFFIRFDQPTLLIIGPNASGKTTLIEAIHLAATGESFRAGKIDELIQFGAPLGRVKAQVLSGSAESEDAKGDQPLDEVEIILTPGEVNNKRTAKRLYVVNGVRRQKKTATALFSSVVFRPEDMRLIEGSPSRRRSFLDGPLSHLFSEYERSLSAYEQTLIRRNKLLAQVREHEQPASSLQFWNLSLVKHGQVLQTYRRAFAEFVHTVAFPVAFAMQYQPSVISQERMHEYVAREIAAGHTLIGPHKDDFMVEITKIAAHADRKQTEGVGRKLQTLNVGQFGSRGEQRLAVLWLKLGELAYLEQTTGRKPILLLDDILSELDSESQAIALSTLKNYQTAISTIDPGLEKIIRAHAPGIQKLVL